MNLRVWPIIALSCLLLAILPAAAQAQVKIGYVDMKRLIDEAPQVAQRRDELELEFAPRNRALVAQEERLGELETRLQRDGDFMTATQRDTLERDVRTLRRDITRTREDLRDEFLFRQNQELQDLESDVNEVIKTFSKQEEFDVVVSSPSVIYFDEQIDITDQVLARLQREFNADQAEAGGRQ